MHHHVPSPLSQQPRRRAKTDDRSTRATIVLYLFFFLLWSFGLVWGIVQADAQTMLWGLPLWFGVSCVGAYTAVSLALVWVVRRYFK